MGNQVKTYPAVGWLRAGGVPNETLLLELNELRKQNTDLQKSVQKLASADKPLIDNIANIDSAHTFHGTYVTYHGRSEKREFECTLSWRELFALIAPYLVEHPNDSTVELQMAKCLVEREGIRGNTSRINDQEFKTITIQFKAYGLVRTLYTKTLQGGMALFWSLTDRGERLMLESRIIRERS